MFGIGMQELLVILVLVLVIFGAKRLPEIGSGLGRAIRNRHHPQGQDQERRRQEGVSLRRDFP